MISVLNDAALAKAVKALIKKQAKFKTVVVKYGNPPMWEREEGFATLLLIILEQQVSLESARATYTKLEKKVGTVTPEALLALSDAELKTITFSRQKIVYGRGLANAVLDGSLTIDKFSSMSDAEVFDALVKLKGIGVWTANVYLLMVLRRPDIWPQGDVALATSYKELMGLETRPTQEDLTEIAKAWQPYRSVAARLLWHFYLSERGKSQ